MKERNQDQTRERLIPTAEDKRKGRRLLLLGLSGFLVVVFFRYQIEDDWRHLLEEDPAKALAALWWGVSLFAMASWAGAFFVWRKIISMAQKTIECQQFPPPGSLILKPTPLLRGAAAIRRGHLLKWTAGVLSFSLIAIPLFLLYLLTLVQQQW
jgi:hypothetical protein